MDRGVGFDHKTQACQLVPIKGKTFFIVTSSFTVWSYAFICLIRSGYKDAIHKNLTFRPLGKKENGCIALYGYTEKTWSLHIKKRSLQINKLFKYFSL